MKVSKPKKAFNSLDGVIIAFFVILFVILAVTAFTKVSWGNEPLTLTVSADKVADDILPDIKAGDKLYTADGAFLGTVTRVSVSRATEIYADTRVDADGGWPLVTVEVPEHSKLVITLDAEADSAPGGYTVNGVSVKVNKSVEFCINGFKTMGYFSSIAEVKQNES